MIGLRGVSLVGTPNVFPSMTRQEVYLSPHTVARGLCIPDRLPSGIKVSPRVALACTNGALESFIMYIAVPPSAVWLTYRQACKRQ